MPIKPTEAMKERRTRVYRALREADPYRYASCAQAADAIGHNWDLSLAARADVEWHLVSAVSDALGLIPKPKQDPVDMIREPYSEADAIGWHPNI